MFFIRKKKHASEIAQTQGAPDHPRDEDCRCDDGSVTPCNVSCAVRKATEALDEQIAQKRALREKVQRVTREVDETTRPFLHPVSSS